MRVDSKEPSDCDTEEHPDLELLQSGQDLDFQAPPPIKTRMLRSKTVTCSTSPLPKTHLRRKMKKGTTLAMTPAIAPSAPRRLDPRLTTDPIVVGKPCWILHPDHGAHAVAFGKSGCSWKTKGQ